MTSVTLTPMPARIAASDSSRVRVACRPNQKAHIMRGTAFSRPALAAEGAFPEGNCCASTRAGVRSGGARPLGRSIAQSMASSAAAVYGKCCTTAANLLP